MRSVGSKALTSLKGRMLTAASTVTRRKDRLVADDRASIATVKPFIASGWVTSSHRLSTPFTTSATSKRLVWWRCDSCDASFKRSVVRHVHLNGQCSFCGECPSSLQSTDSCNPKAFRRLTSRATLWATNDRRVRRSVNDLQTTDAGTLRSRQKSSSSQPLPISRRNLQPMLALSWNDCKETLSPRETVMVSPKLDGIRCVAVWDPLSHRVVLLSRHGTLIESCVHISLSLKPLFDLDRSLVLDGELYHHTAFSTFDELSGLVRRQRAVPDKKAHCSGHSQNFDDDMDRIRQIQYHVFDVMHSDLWEREPTHRTRTSPLLLSQLAKLRLRFLGGPSSFAARFALLQLLCSTTLPEPSHVRVVPSVRCKRSDVDRHLRQALRKGYEGVMVRRLGQPYAFGKRTSTLLKYKKIMDDEFPIADVVEGSGRWKRSLAAFICRTKRGHQFSATPATTEDRRRQLWLLRDQMIGKYLTVQFQEFTHRGVPRFPVGKAIRGSACRTDWL